MNESDIENYAKSLLALVGTAAILKRASIEGGEWQPQANMCHDNVTMWCDISPSYKPVRGWLYFDLQDMPFVKFIAHSVVRTPAGELRDITPSNASQEYPFIESGLSNEEYEELVEANGCRHFTLKTNA